MTNAVNLANLPISGPNGAIQLPIGTTAQRPTTPTNGLMRFNTDVGVTEIYNGSEWRDVVTDRTPVVTRGLVMFLDAGDYASYPQGGSVWNNMVTYPNRPALIRGTPTWVSDNGGGIVTPANQIATWIELPELVLQTNPTADQWTVTWGLTVLSGTASGERYGCTMSIAGGNEFIPYFIPASSSFGVGSLTSGSLISYTVNTPLIITMTNNGATVQLFKNGVFVGTCNNAAFDVRSIAGWVADQEQDTVKGTFQNTQNLNARHHFMHFYNRVLTNAEILGLAQTTRVRLGI
jgi:hypothetical protein